MRLEDSTIGSIAGATPSVVIAQLGDSAHGSRARVRIELDKVQANQAQVNLGLRQVLVAMQTGPRLIWVSWPGPVCYQTPHRVSTRTGPPGSRRLQRLARRFGGLFGLKGSNK